MTKLETQWMETLWGRGEASIREMQEAFPEQSRPGYTTVQKVVYRMEDKQFVKRTRKIGNFHLLTAGLAREVAERRLVDDLIAMFGGRFRPVMAHLFGAGKLTLADIEIATVTLKHLTATKPKKMLC